jgi:hypothetical protein
LDLPVEAADIFVGVVVLLSVVVVLLSVFEIDLVGFRIPVFLGRGRWLSTSPIYVINTAKLSAFLE